MVLWRKSMYISDYKDPIIREIYIDIALNKCLGYIFFLKIVPFFVVDFRPNSTFQKSCTKHFRPVNVLPTGNFI